MQPRVTTRILHRTSAAVLAVLLLAACASDATEGVATPDAARDATVRFGSYVARTTTRAGVSADINTSRLADVGLGVFAYYTATDPYTDLNDEAATPTPQRGVAPLFFDNEQVFTDQWTYTNIHYWPNPVDAAHYGQVSFFAYAPYVTAAAAAADKASASAAGIVELPTSAVKGDPIVGYRVATTPDRSVDLLWAVDATTHKPHLDRTKDDSADGIVRFSFHHALAALRFTAQAYIDDDATLVGAPDETNVADVDSTRVTIASVTLSGADFAQDGRLNLNSTDVVGSRPVPRWTDITRPVAPLTLSLSGAAIDAQMLDQGAKKTVDMKTAGGDRISGVTQTAAPVAANAQSFYVIPSAADGGYSPTGDYLLTVDYYVTTDDVKLGTAGYSRIHNRISARLSDLTFEAGRAYTFRLRLGLRSFQASLAVTDVWDDVFGADGIDIPVTVIYERGSSAGESLAPERRTASPAAPAANAAAAPALLGIPRPS